MLVLSRKLGEKIYISENICITVVDIDRGKIRLGIEAPREVPIFRQDLLQTQDKQPPAAHPWAVSEEPRNARAAARPGERPRRAAPPRFSLTLLATDHFIWASRSA